LPTNLLSYTESTRYYFYSEVLCLSIQEKLLGNELFLAPTSASTFVDRTMAKVMSTSLSRDVPLVVERTQDVWIYDVDGNEFLDMTSGVGVNERWPHKSSSGGSHKESGGKIPSLCRY